MTLRRATVVAVEKWYIFCVCVCSLRYPACNAHAQYCHLRSVRLSHLHYLIHGTFFQKHLLSIKCLLWLSLRFCLKHF